MNKNDYDVWEEMKNDPFFGPFIAFGLMIFSLFKYLILLIIGKKEELHHVTCDDLKKSVTLPMKCLEDPTAFAYSYRRKSAITFNGINLDLHSIIVGTTGSGKTILSERIIYDSLIQNKTVFFIDPKGSLDTRDRLQRMAHNFNRKFYSVSNFGDLDNEISLKLFEGASGDQVKNALMKVLDWSEQFYMNASEQGLEKVLKSIYKGNLDLEAVVQGLSDLGDDESVGALHQLKNVCSSDLYQIINGEKKKSIADLRDENAVVYIGLSSLGYPDATKTLGKLLTYNFTYHASRVESRQICPVEDVQIIFDEFVSIGTDDIVHVANKIRSARMTLGIVIQCISDLDYIGINMKGQIFGNANNFFIGHSHVPSDVEFICSVLGTQDSEKTTSQVEDNEVTGKGSIREVQQFKVHPEIIRNLNPGQFVICSGIPHRYWDIVSVIFRDYTKIKSADKNSKIQEETAAIENVGYNLADEFRRNKSG